MERFQACHVGEDLVGICWYYDTLGTPSRGSPSAGEPGVCGGTEGLHSLEGFLSDSRVFVGLLTLAGDTRTLQNYDTLRAPRGE